METSLQLNITVSNAIGSLAALSDKLRAADVNISAISCAPGASTSVLHLIVDDPETAKFVLQPLYKMTMDEVLVFRAKSRPGVIASVARACAAAGISIRDIYATTVGKGKEAIMYVLVDNIEKAQELLEQWEQKFGPVLN